MSKPELALSITATILPVVAFVEKHSTFFVGAAAILSCGWWCFIYVKKIFIPFIKSLKK